MTGYIKITAVTRNGHEGLNVQADMQNVSFMDRMQALDVLCRALHISSMELKVFVTMRSKGIFAQAFEVKHTQDEPVEQSDAGLVDQLLDTVLGGDNK